MKKNDIINIQMTTVNEMYFLVRNNIQIICNFIFFEIRLSIIL